MADNGSNDSWLRTLTAALVGLVGAVVIWVATPYNNFIVGSSNLTDGYLPTGVLCLTLILVLVVNPLLRGLRPHLALTSRQLAVALGIMLIACVLPGQGLLRPLPHGLTKSAREASEKKFLAEQYSKMDLPAGLFPDKMGFGQDVQASEGYINELGPGESVPWRAWTGTWRHPGPLWTWGIFLLFCWMMMMGLAAVVLPQWRHNERLAFPLLTVQHALIETPPEGRLFPTLLRQRSFWIAAGSVFLLHLLIGVNLYSPESVPMIPLKWDLSSLFTEEPWRQMSGYVRQGNVYFLFIGLAFFMPTRISFSIWFFLVAYAMWRTFAPVYGITFYIDKMDDHRYGAAIALTIAVLWLGRAQWARVFGSLFRRPRSDADGRDRQSGWTFLVGVAGMFGWLLWVGVQPGWAIMLVAFAFMVSLLISRVVAETGMPFVRINENPLTLMRLAPASWIGAASLYMSVVINLIFSIGSRINTAAMATHAIGLDEQAGPKRQSGMAVSLLGVLAVGLLIAGAANLWTSYHHSSTLDGRPAYTSGTSHLDAANDSVMQLSRGELSQVPYNRYVHLGFGAGLAGGLYYLCLAVPQWPLHPFGILLIDSYYGHTAWASIFFGWLLQILVVRFGGARLYRSARPFFLGLIVGEVVAAIFWGLTPPILAAMDVPYRQVPVLPG